MKKEQRVWLMGVPSHGQEVIKTLQKLGGENVYGLDGEREDSIYFINHEGIISSTIKDETGRLIMDFYQKIDPAKWKDGDVLVHDDYPFDYAVLRKYNNDDTFEAYFILEDNTAHFDETAYVEDYHLASEEEREKVFKACYAMAFKLFAVDKNVENLRNAKDYLYNAIKRLEEGDD